jgi:hypothetical protein
MWRIMRLLNGEGGTPKRKMYRGMAWAITYILGRSMQFSAPIFLSRLAAHICNL